MRSNAPSARVCRLVWGSEGDPLKTLGLTREPDVVLASDVVYGNDPKKWRALVDHIRHNFTTTMSCANAAMPGYRGWYRMHTATQSQLHGVQVSI